jgi:hypothetical protein
MAMMFLSAPPISTPTTSSVPYSRKYGARNSACTRSTTCGSREAIDTAVGSSRASSIAKLGPDSTATRAAGAHSCSITSEMRNSVWPSSPFVALTTVAPRRISGAALRSTSRVPCEGTAAITRSLRLSASLRSPVTRRFVGKRISGK